MFKIFYEKFLRIIKNDDQPPGKIYNRIDIPLIPYR